MHQKDSQIHFCPNIFLLVPFDSFCHNCIKTTSTLGFNDYSNPNNYYYQWYCEKGEIPGVA